MITTKDKKWNDLARKFLSTSTHSKYRMVAILVKGGRLISAGANKENSAPKRYVKQIRTNMSLHAEVCCLSGISKEASRGATIYIVGETAKGNSMLTAPCESCLSFIFHMDLKRIVYETKENKLEEIKL